jgi:predicted NAD/FAD-dependent oxidoreductase
VVEALRAAALAVDLAPLRPTVLTGNLAGAAAGFLAAAVLAGADLAAVVLAGAALTGPRVEVLREAGLAASLRV